MSDITVGIVGGMIGGQLAGSLLLGLLFGGISGCLLEIMNVIVRDKLSRGGK